MYKESLVWILSASLLLAVSITQTGCSHTTKKTETETVTEGPQEVTTVEKNTTTETTHEECGGVLSCTVDAVGTVIALPFKAVGALIGGIF